MGFEKNEIEVCLTNMYENARLYEQIAETKNLQGYEKELTIASAKYEAWIEAAQMLEAALAVEREGDIVKCPKCGKTMVLQEVERGKSKLCHWCMYCGYRQPRNLTSGSS